MKISRIAALPLAAAIAAGVATTASADVTYTLTNQTFTGFNFSNLLAAQRYVWPNGASSAPGTSVSGTVTLITALNLTGSDLNVWIGNGYGAAGTSGTWSGTVTLHGVSVVPAPGAIALLGLAGLAGRRRR